MKELKLDGKALSLDKLEAFLEGGVLVSATDEARATVRKSARFCESIAQGNEAYYGINTGFGVLAKKRVPKESLRELQENLLRSHATGMGEELHEDIVRLMMVLRVNSLLLGYSGISVDAIDYLLTFVNAGLTPVVPSHGSVGASGDLAPLAHMSLPLIGEGRVRLNGEVMESARALERLNLEPLELKPKEGLALINGTQLMSSFAVHETLRSIRFLKSSVVAAAMSIEAYMATDKVFEARIHELKNHPGQIAIAAGFRRVLASSEVIASHKDCDRVQDPYSFRCVAQVYGAVLDTVRWVAEWVTREINAVTDNPLIFVEDGDVVSGGNFHGEHMAFSIDALCIAMSEVGSISERRVDKLLDNDTPKLPQCLIKDPGLNSGLMVTQYLAAALVSENKIYAHPASVDSIPTSAGFEDHVSMGSIGALKLAKIVDNVGKIISIELLCAAQAMDFLKPMTGGVGSRVAHRFVRDRIPFIEKDTILSDYLEILESVVRDGSLVAEVERALGEPIFDCPLEAK